MVGLAEMLYMSVYIHIYISWHFHQFVIGMPSVAISCFSTAFTVMLKFSYSYPHLAQHTGRHNIPTMHIECWHKAKVIGAVVYQSCVFKSCQR